MAVIAGLINFELLSYLPSISVSTANVKLLTVIALFSVPSNPVCQTSPLFLTYEEVVFGYSDFASVSSLEQFYAAYVKLLFIYDLRN